VQGFDRVGAPGAETLVVAMDCAAHPVQVHAIRAGKAPQRLERFNDELLARVSFGETREVTVKGALGDKVQMFLTFPPRFDAKKKHLSYCRFRLLPVIRRMVRWRFRQTDCFRLAIEH